MLVRGTSERPDTHSCEGACISGSKAANYWMTTKMARPREFRSLGSTLIFCQGRGYGQLVSGGLQGLFWR